jgi:hypothetical protein
MDWKEFVASLVGSLIWPIAILILVLLLRKQLVRAAEALPFARAKHMTVGATGINLEFFDEQIGVVQEALIEQGGQLTITPTAASIASASSVDQSHIEALLDVSPRAAVIEAFARTELVFRDVAARGGQAKADKLPFTSVMDWLHSRATIGTSTYEAGLGLLRTRNEVLHGQDEIDRDRALQFLALAAELRSRLDRNNL